MSKAAGMAHKVFVGGLAVFTVYGVGAISLGMQQIGASRIRHGELGHVKEDYGDHKPIPMWTPAWERDTVNEGGGEPGQL